jgi:hypothetical protein
VALLPLAFGGVVLAGRAMALDEPRIRDELLDAVEARDVVKLDVTSAANRASGADLQHRAHSKFAPRAPPR